MRSSIRVLQRTENDYSHFLRLLGSAGGSSAREGPHRGRGTCAAQGHRLRYHFVAWHEPGHDATLCQQSVKLKSFVLANRVSGSLVMAYIAYDCAARLSTRIRTRGIGPVEITRPFCGFRESECHDSNTCSLRFGGLVLLELLAGLLDIVPYPNANCNSRGTAQTRAGQHVT